MKKIALLFMFQLIYLVGKTQDPFFDWAKASGSPGGDITESITVDQDGNLYSAGTFWGTVDFDPGSGTQNLTAVGFNDIFIQKLDKNGNFVWVKALQGTNQKGVSKIHYDSYSNNIYLTGVFAGTVDFDPGSLIANTTANGTYDMFILCLNLAGGYVASYAAGVTGGSTYGNSLITDQLGNLYTVGVFTGTVDFDPSVSSAPLTSVGGSDVFVQKLSAFGTLVWAKRYGSTTVFPGDEVYDIALDVAGNPVIVGGFYGTTNFNPAGVFNLISNGSKDIYINKLDASGTFLWAKSMGGTGVDNVYSIEIDVSDNIFTCGNFENTVDFDPSGVTYNLTSTGVSDGYIQKLDASGNFQWTVALTGSAASYKICKSIDSDLSGNVYVTGSFNNSMDIDPGTNVNNHNAAGLSAVDLFILKLDNAGNYLWSHVAGDIQAEIPTDICVKSINEFYIGGGTHGAFDMNTSAICNLPSSLLPHAGQADLFSARWEADPDGWHQTTEGTLVSEIYNDVVTDSDGNVYVVGTYTKGTTLNGGGNPDITISSLSSSTSLPNTFLAKYDPCGNLVWVNKSDTYTKNSGNGIILDENSGKVYITGNFNQNIRFPNACGATAVLITGAISNQGYVAQFDMATGCAYFVNLITIPGSTFIDCRAITVNENNGNIFIGGQLTIPAFTPTPSNSFVFKFIPTTTMGLGNSLNTSIWTITGFGNNKPWDRVNDLDFNENTNQLYLTGYYKGTMKLTPGFASLNSISGGDDAFVAIYQDNGITTSQVAQWAGNVTGQMYGEGIAVNETNNMAYLTGTYKGFSNNPFNLLSYGITALPSFTNETAYMIGIDFNTTSAWSKTAYVALTSGKTFGREVTCNDENVFFVGDFSKNSITIQSIGTFPFYGGSSVTSENFHIFTASYNSSGVALNANVTKSGTSTSADNHTARSIFTDNYNHCFVVGQYYKKMGYYSGIPSSGVLASTGAGAHSFVMRTIQSTGEYKMNEGQIEEEIVDFITKGNLNVYPNPTNGLTTIAIDNFDANNTNYKLVLYNSVGQLMQQLNISSNKTDIDLSDYKNGLYILSYSDGVTTGVVRISKIN